MRPDIDEVMSRPISKQLVDSNIPARLAYTALDGTPRVIPIAFGFDGGTFHVWTLPHAPKIKALAVNPNVAITVDTAGQWPPRALLVRGTATMEEVEGVPQGYLDASQKITPAEEFEAWKVGVMQLYKRMVRIDITPTWAKLLDFETTIPKPVEDLITGRA